MDNMQPKHRRIFVDLPEGIDETWQHGALLGGIAEGGYDRLAIADSYKLASELLIERTLQGLDGYELVYPILYNYRQCLELYLKIIVKQAPRKHGLSHLVKALEKHITSHYGATPPQWVTDLILEIDEFDPAGTAFRYDEVGVFSRTTGDTGEFWIDFHQLKKWMDGLLGGLRKLILDREDTATVCGRRS